MQAIVLSVLAVLAAAFAPMAAQAAPKASDLVRVELVAEPRAIQAGQAFTVGMRLSMKEHWHVYWRNPGDSGLAPEIAWTLPPGFSAGPIQWPTPSRIPVSHLVNYGYEGETTLLVEITPPARLPASGPVELKALVSYLVCERECIPGEATVALSTPVASGPEAGGPDGAVRYVFEAARAALPSPSPWASRFEPDGERLKLRVDAPGLRSDRVTSAYFFAADETALDHAAPQPMAIDGGGLTLTLQRSSVATGPAPSALAGILVVEETLDTGPSRQAVQIGTLAAMPVAAGTGAASLASPRPAPDMGVAAVLGAALLAFLGGLILNLMPCVFPVLSIKVLSLVRHSGQGSAGIRKSGLAYTAGVVASFVALAAMLLAARAAGAEIGWGFQLQSPGFVVATAFLLFAVGLSLSGAVEFGTSIAARAGALDSGSGTGGSFMTGVLAAVVATPCTAPFMAGAVGYALTAPAAVALTIFVALGLGMAAPFLALTFWPALLARMPRPGPWMERFKQVLAFPIYATVAWLLFVLSQEVGPTGLFAALIGLVVIGFAAWSWRIAAGEGWGGRFGQGLVAASLIGLAFLGWQVALDATGRDARPAVASASGPEPFTQARLDALRSEGRPTFVNMTAAWCITCIVNERAVLSTEAVRRRFESGNVAYLKGDWTNQNPEITRVLERHGRGGVPLYVFYPARGEPLVLPQILTQSLVLESLGPVGIEAKRASLSTP